MTTAWWLAMLRWVDAGFPSDTCTTLWENPGSMLVSRPLRNLPICPKVEEVPNNHSTLWIETTGQPDQGRMQTKIRTLFFWWSDSRGLTVGFHLITIATATTLGKERSHYEFARFWRTFNKSWSYAKGGTNEPKVIFRSLLSFMN